GPAGAAGAGVRSRGGAGRGRAHPRAAQGGAARRAQDQGADRRRPAVSLVFDASLTLGWYFEDERTAAVDAVLDRVIEEGAVVPTVWRYEVANGLQMAVRRGRIDAAYRDNSLAELRLLPISVDRDGDELVWTAVLGFADR